MYKIQIDDEIRDATAEEIEIIEANQAEIAAKEAEIAAKEELKKAGLAKLTALGLDIDELKALGF